MLDEKLCPNCEAFLDEENKCLKCSYKHEFSAAEYRLFMELGYQKFFIELPTWQSHPLGLYRLAAEEMFCKNLYGPDVDALRRGLTALNDSTLKRHTEEFDKLISFPKKFSELSKKELVELLKSLHKFVSVEANDSDAYMDAAHEVREQLKEYGV